VLGAPEFEAVLQERLHARDRDQERRSAVMSVSGVAARCESVVDIRVLGDFEVIVAGRALGRSDWQRLSSERLVKLLAVTPGHRLSRESAAETLWPGAAPEPGRANLRKALHFASRALDGTAMLRVEGDTIGLCPQRFDIDLDRLEAACIELDVAAGDAAEGSRAVVLDTILELGGRDLLPGDVFEDWLVAPRERLRTRWQRLALAAADHLAGDGRNGEAHELVDRVLERDPTDEAAHRLAIGLYGAEGRHHAARRQFDLCRSALREQLDIDPSPETRAAFESAERNGAAAVGRVLGRDRIVARRAELELLEPLLDRLTEGRLSVALIRGPAGIGKTRLLEELVAYARVAGARVIEWQAVETMRAFAFGPFRVALPRLVDDADLVAFDEPSRGAFKALVPHLSSVPGLVFEDRTALVSGLVGAIGQIARRRPLCIAIDDLPWLDAASLEVVTAALSGLADVGILIVATQRDGEAAPDAVVTFADQVRRIGGLELRLGPFAARDIQPLVVGHLGGASLDPKLARMVFDQSLGNPLFCLELVRAGRDDGSIRLESGRWSLASSAVARPLPATIRNVVARRSAALSPATRELLTMAAELGPEFDLGTLEDVFAGLGGGVLAALDEAIESGLLVEHGNGYTFAHPLFRLAARDGAGHRRRGETCFAIARALAGSGARVDEPASLELSACSCPDPVRVADPALTAVELGVTAAIPLAVTYGFVAGEREERLFNRDAATSLLTRALAAWCRMPEKTRVEVHASGAQINLARLRIAAGDDASAIAAFREAISSARGPEELADVYSAFYWLPYHHGDFQAAIAILEEGLARLPPTAAVQRAQLRRDFGWCLARMRRLDDALEVLASASDVLEAAGSPREAMRALDLLGALLDTMARREAAIGCLERSLVIALDLPDVRGEMLARLHLGATLTRSGRPTAGRPHAVRAVELARLIGDRYVESVAEWMLAELEDATGDLAAAADCRRRELALLASIGGNAHNEALAHAHLALVARRMGDHAAAARQTDLARACAGRSVDREYPARIEKALAVACWAQTER
jgi:DNA-binding SARP family transcriptional activator/tetratricopeptide (TPR) repeat protein